MSDVVFIDNSKEALQALSDAVDASLEAVGNQAVSYAKSNITAAGRVNTGALRNSISHVVQDEAAYVGTNISYAIYNEYGTGVYAEGGRGRKTPWAYRDDKGNLHFTHGMPPIHFLKRAVEEHIPQFLKIIESVMKSHQP